MPVERLVEVTRGEHVESFHVGAVAVCDSEGTLLARAGDPGLTANLRSAAKPFQAHHLLVSGGADRYALTDEEIALTCSSHYAEPFHVTVAETLLEKAEATVEDLHCGAHWPGHEETAAAMRASGKTPTAIHNNCSGKHAGMLLASRLGGFSLSDYWQPGRALQERVLDWMGRYLSLPRGAIGQAVDGCSVPSFQVPLRAAAAAYARLLEDDPEIWPLSDLERTARDRITRAMRAHPEYVRGTGSLTTSLMRFFGGSLLAKEGAEAFYAMALRADDSERVREALALPKGPPRAIGIALKIADGHDRGRPPVILETLRQTGILPEAVPRDLQEAHHTPVFNVRGDLVGAIRPVFRLAPP